MRQTLLWFLAFTFGVIIVVAGVFVVHLPQAALVLSKFEPTPLSAVASENIVANANPYHIETGTYTLIQGSVAMAISHPRDDAEVYIGALPVENSALTIDTDSTGDLIGSGSIMLDLTQLTITTNTATAYEPSVFTNGTHFFNVGTYPTLTIAIDSIRKMSNTNNRFIFSGTMTALGQTHPVSFPATIFPRDGLLRLEGDLAFDRTRWGMTYASASFVGQYAPNAIDDTIRTTFSLSFVREE